jgi:putative ABC transport system permease protein
VPYSVPLPVLGGGVAAAVIVGVLAGAFPSARAARLAPADALRL